MARRDRSERAVDSPGMTTPDLKRARAVLEAKAAGRGGRIRATLQREVLGTVQAAHDAGLSYERIAEALGIRSRMLNRWRRRERRLRAKHEAERSGASTPEAEFVAVRVPLSASGLIVYGPAGLRIEGLSIDNVAELCRRLA